MRTAQRAVPTNRNRNLIICASELMKRSTWIFFLAILLPSIGLGWLALRSAGEQQIILERRTAELYQKETDNVASNARASIENERRTFAERIRQLLTNSTGPELARNFST